MFNRVDRLVDYLLKNYLVFKRNNVSHKYRIPFCVRLNVLYSYCTK